MNDSLYRSYNDHKMNNTNEHLQHVSIARVPDACACCHWRAGVTFSLPWAAPPAFAFASATPPAGTDASGCMGMLPLRAQMLRASL